MQRKSPLQQEAGYTLGNGDHKIGLINSVRLTIMRKKEIKNMKRFENINLKVLMREKSLSGVPSMKLQCF